MTHKFGVTPFPLTVTRTNRLSKRQVDVEVTQREEITSLAQSEDPALDGNSDNPLAEGTDK